jgi:hypothetical protein
MAEPMDFAQRLDAAVKWCGDHAFLAGFAAGAIALKVLEWIF